MSQSVTHREIASQPEVWRTALTRTAEARTLLAAPGEKMLILGCGTSAFMAASLAELRERAGLGETHWAYASEPPAGRAYDRVVALTRSGTTTEVLDAVEPFRGTTQVVGICAVAGMPLEAVADDVLILDFADEQSVVQTRFPTSVVLLARAAFGEQVESLIGQAESALAGPLPVPVTEFDHFVSLGRGWTVGLAHESALKIREAAQAWAESYPALDYRHGPIAVAGERSLVWIHGPAAGGLADDIRAVGATVVNPAVDPLVSLVLAQRAAVALALARGLDPDRPRHLTRSVVLGAHT